MSPLAVTTPAASTATAAPARVFRHRIAVLSFFGHVEFTRSGARGNRPGQFKREWCSEGATECAGLLAQVNVQASDEDDTVAHTAKDLHSWRMCQFVAKEWDTT
ncbi:hypothetical protein GCM10010178_16530 [Lentzea flava]|uniref:Uncharacterized protein n=1 Tax=Lentzea flava TaxID=103732 RepID=A0ABQ2UDM6_9PSEU|nr:hypothetical protein GCM10010178_16530 [Lentzea flava]